MRLQRPLNGSRLIIKTVAMIPTLAEILLLGILYLAATATCNDYRIFNVCIPNHLQKAAFRVKQRLNRSLPTFTSDYMQVYEDVFDLSLVAKFCISPFCKASPEVKQKHGDNYESYNTTVTTHLQTLMERYAKESNCIIKLGTGFWYHDPWIRSNYCNDGDGYDIANNISRCVNVSDDANVTTMRNILHAQQRLFVTCCYHGPDP